MINQETIKELYRKFPQPSNNLRLELFKEGFIKHHNLLTTDNDLIINSVDKDSPFHEIPLRNIAAIEDFPDFTAIILRNSILFLNKSNNDIHVHIKMEQMSLWDKVKNLFNPK